MSKELQDEFANRFQRAATELVRMYSTAFTVMEIEMGSAVAHMLAPHYLGEIVEAAERVSCQEMRDEAEVKRAKEIAETAKQEGWDAFAPAELRAGLAGEAQASEEAAGEPSRRQLTIWEALARGGEPW